MCMRLWGAGPEERQWPSLLAEDTSSANNKAISILLFNIHAASYQFNQSKKDYLYLTLVLLFEFFVPSFVFCDCILCVRYFLDKIDISLPRPGYPANSFDRLFEFFSLCFFFFYVLDFLVDIGIFPHGPGCSTSSFDPLFEFCVFFFLSFQCVRFSGLNWHFPPSGLVALSALLISCLRDFRSASFDEQESLHPERLNIFNQIHQITIKYTNTKIQKSTSKTLKR